MCGGRFPCVQVLRFLEANKSTYVSPFARLQKEVEAAWNKNATNGAPGRTTRCKDATSREVEPKLTAVLKFAQMRNLRTAGKRQMTMFAS